MDLGYYFHWRSCSRTPSSEQGQLWSWVRLPKGQWVGNVSKGGSLRVLLCCSECCIFYYVTCFSLLLCGCCFIHLLCFCVEPSKRKRKKSCVNVHISHFVYIIAKILKQPTAGSCEDGFQWKLRCCTSGRLKHQSQIAELLLSNFTDSSFQCAYPYVAPSVFNKPQQTSQLWARVAV